MNEAELLFTQVLNCQRQDLYLNRDKKLDKKSSVFFSRVLKQRLLGQPIQYILGKTEFMGLEFKVMRGVFIPRPETEILLQCAIKVIGSQGPAFGGRQVTKLKILDMGTGSGCIAVSLAKLFPDIEITATDISPIALRVARENAKINDVEVNFIKSNLFSALDPQSATYGMILSNPPYISASEIKGLAPEVRYEPRVALDGGSDGLDFYRRIIKDSWGYLEDSGYLILEMGFNQRKAIEKIIDASRRFSIVRIIRDYNNIERVVVLQKSGS
jgi:release factor glutamine methyltransferase